MTSTSPWPPALDALVAAPVHHRLLLENARVRVLEPGSRRANAPRSIPTSGPPPTTS